MLYQIACQLQIIASGKLMLLLNRRRINGNLRWAVHWVALRSNGLVIRNLTVPAHYVPVWYRNCALPQIGSQNTAGSLDQMAIFFVGSCN